jgi:tetratricopeptide (TPR) repeat protein
MSAIDDDFFAQATAMMDAMHTTGEVNDIDDGEREEMDADYEMDGDDGVDLNEVTPTAAQYWASLAMRGTENAESLEQALLAAPGGNEEDFTGGTERNLALIESRDQDRDQMELDRSQLECSMDPRLDRTLVNTQKRRGRRKKLSRLTPEGSRLYNLASKSFLMGDYAEAQQFLQQTIQICPMAAEPYQTLGAIYEDMGNTDKALLFYMVAAHLRPQRADQWRHTATLFRFVCSLYNDNLINLKSQGKLDN